MRLTMRSSVLRRTTPRAGYEGYFIFDADNLLDANYVAEMNKVFDSGCRVITSYRNSKNYDSNWISAGSALWFLREAKYLNNSRMIPGGPIARYLVPVSWSQAMSSVRMAGGSTTCSPRTSSSLSTAPVRASTWDIARLRSCTTSSRSPLSSLGISACAGRRDSTRFCALWTQAAGRHHQAPQASPAMIC